MLHGGEGGADVVGERGADLLGQGDGVFHGGVAFFSVEEHFDLAGLVVLFGCHSLIDAVKGFDEGVVHEFGGEVDAGFELGAGEGVGFCAPSDFVALGGGVGDFEDQAVEVLLEGDQGHAGGKGVVLGGVSGGDAEGVARAFYFELVVGKAEDLVAGGGSGGFGAEVDGVRADIALNAETFEESIGHDDLAGPAGVDTVLAGDAVVGAVFGFGRAVLGDHGPEDVGEGDFFLFGDLDVDVAEFEQVQVELFLGVGLRFGPGGDFADAAGGAEDDAHAVIAEGPDDAGLDFTVAVADGGFVGAVAVVVHAIAGGGDGGLEAEAIVGHAGSKTRGSLAAPTVLAGGDLQLGQGDGQIGLHDAGVHFLLGDGIADDGQTITFLQEQPGGLGGGEGFVGAQDLGAGGGVELGVECDGRAEQGRGEKNLGELHDMHAKVVSKGGFRQGNEG